MEAGLEGRKEVCIISYLQLATTVSTTHAWGAYRLVSFFSLAIAL